MKIILAFPPCFVTLPGSPNQALRETHTAMPIDIKLSVTLSLEESALEDALSEYDELTVSELVKQVLDKAIALDAVDAAVLEGPNTLEEYDKFTSSGTGG